jgi:hypothetical protein
MLPTPGHCQRLHKPLSCDSMRGSGHDNSAHQIPLAIPALLRKALCAASEETARASDPTGLPSEHTTLRHSGAEDLTGRDGLTSSNTSRHDDSYVTASSSSSTGNTASAKNSKPGGSNAINVREDSAHIGQDGGTQERFKLQGNNVNSSAIAAHAARLEKRIPMAESLTACIAPCVNSPSSAECLPTLPNLRGHGATLHQASRVVSPLDAVVQRVTPNATEHSGAAQIGTPSSRLPSVRSEITIPQALTVAAIEPHESEIVGLSPEAVLPSHETAAPTRETASVPGTLWDEGKGSIAPCMPPASVAKPPNSRSTAPATPRRQLSLASDDQCNVQRVLQTSPPVHSAHVLNSAATGQPADAAQLAHLGYPAGRKGVSAGMPGAKGPVGARSSTALTYDTRERSPPKRSPTAHARPTCTVDLGPFISMCRPQRATGVSPPVIPDTQTAASGAPVGDVLQASGPLQVPAATEGLDGLPSKPACSASVSPILRAAHLLHADVPKGAKSEAGVLGQLVVGQGSRHAAGAQAPTAWHHRSPRMLDLDSAKMSQTGRATGNAHDSMAVGAPLGPAPWPPWSTDLEPSDDPPAATCRQQCSNIVRKDAPLWPNTATSYPTASSQLLDASSNMASPCLTLSSVHPDSLSNAAASHQRAPPHPLEASSESATRASACGESSKLRGSSQMSVAAQPLQLPVQSSLRFHPSSSCSCNHNLGRQACTLHGDAVCEVQPSSVARVTASIASSSSKDEEETSMLVAVNGLSGRADDESSRSSTASPCGRHHTVSSDEIKCRPEVPTQRVPKATGQRDTIVIKGTEPQKAEVTQNRQHIRLQTQHGMPVPAQISRRLPQKGLGAPRQPEAELVSFESSCSRRGDAEVVVVCRSSVAGQQDRWTRHGAGVAKQVVLLPKESGLLWNGCAGERKGEMRRPTAGRIGAGTSSGSWQGGAVNKAAAAVLQFWQKVSGVHKGVEGWKHLK